MASNITPTNINGAYPVAGQDNDSQGFRDNFTNIKNNFIATKTEIESLQSLSITKGVVNELSGTTLSNAQTRNFTKTYGGTVPPQTGSITIDVGTADLTRIDTSGPITLVFSSWPTTLHSYATTQVWINVTNILHTITLPTEVIYGSSNVPGVDVNTGIITALTTGAYLLEFGSIDNGSSVSVSTLIVPGSNDIDVSSFQSNVTILQGNVSTLQSNVTILQGNVSTLQGNIDTNTAAISSLTGRMISAEDDINTIEATISTLQSNNDTADAATNANVTILQGNVTALQSDITSLFTYSFNGSEEISNGVAANTSVSSSYFTTALPVDDDISTLATGTEGFVKTLCAFDIPTGTGNMVITVSNAGWKSVGTGTITFTAIGQSCTLQYINDKWFCIGNNGATFG